MLRATRSRTATLLVFAAYFAAHTLGALVHNQLHQHAAGEVLCCHSHAGADHAGHRHGHDDHGRGTSRPAQDRGPADGLNIFGVASAADHACIVCRLSGQPVVSAPSAAIESSAALCLANVDAPQAAPRTTSARISQSRAPPAAV